MHGNLHIHQYSGSNNLEDIQYLHASEITDLATGEIISGDVLIHVGGFFTSLEDWEQHRTDGGNPTPGGNDTPAQPGSGDWNCNDREAVLMMIDPETELMNWVNATPYINECINDDFFIWMFDSEGITCCQQKSWMSHVLSSHNKNFETMGDDVEYNRPWMHIPVQDAMFNRWYKCFPDFD